MSARNTLYWMRSKLIRAACKVINTKLPMTREQVCLFLDDHRIPHMSLATPKRICTGVVIRTDGKGNVIKVFPV